MIHKIDYVYSPTNKVKLQEIKVGQCFRAGGEVYQRVNITLTKEYGFYYCNHLKSGVVTVFSIEENVVPLDLDICNRSEE